MDLLLYNGKIYTVDSTFSVSGAMVVHQGRVVETGSLADLKAKYHFTEEKDLEGAFVYPGFIDAHCHFFGYGLGAETRADLTGTTSMREVVERLMIWHKEHPTPWIEGRGWDQNDWTVKEFPDRALLDSLFPDIPVMLTRVDGHAMLVNGKALRMAGIDATTQVSGGSILVREGSPTGILIDNAIELVRDIIPEADTALMYAALLRAQEDCHAVGLTMVADAGLRDKEIDAVRHLQGNGRLSMRIYAMLNPDPQTLQPWLASGPSFDEQLIVRSIKMYADGALGSRGALMLEPYSDRPGEFGLEVNDVDSLRRMAALARKHGFQLNVHCIGDAAVRRTLDVYSGFLEPGNDMRWRIEHAQVVHPDDLSRFGRLGVIPSVQATHATSDMYWAEERLGPRISHAYAYRDLMKENGWIPNGTDFPIERIDPLLTFYAAVFRKDARGWPEGGFQPENALSREEALRSMTVWAARSCFAEQFTGSLEAGKVADFIILDGDIITAEEKIIPSIKVAETWSGGKRVY